MPQAPVIFADIEAYLTDYLTGMFPDYLEDPVTVRNTVPDADPFPARLVVVRRDGGRREQHLEFPRLGVRVWAADDGTATDLALLTASLIVACPDGLPVVRAVQLSGPSALPEENGKSYRYMTFELTARGVALDPLQVAEPVVV